MYSSVKGSRIFAQGVIQSSQKEEKKKKVKLTANILGALEQTAWETNVTEKARLGPQTLVNCVGVTNNHRACIKTV